jgi:uncharacterized protein
MADSCLAAAYLASTKRFLELPQAPDARRMALAGLRLEWEQLFADMLSKEPTSYPEMWFALGHGYSNGWGTERNHEAAESMFHRAAETGHTKAMVRLAYCLRRTEDPEKRQLAHQWMRRAAEAGDSSGMVDMGFTYREGREVEHDYETAALWFTKAYRAGANHAADLAGKLYAFHMHRPGAAIPWFLLAWEAGIKDSLIHLAMLYDDTNTPYHDPAEAHHWYQKAATELEGGSGFRAMLALAINYRNGQGVSPDIPTARSWLARLLQESPPVNEFHKAGLKLLSEINSSLL